MKTNETKDPKHTWHPAFWKEETHGQAWARVQEALKRDWEQTKADIKVGGKELNQDVTDTVKQATGQAEIPGGLQSNPETLHHGKEPREWSDVEPAVRYGYAARTQFGTRFPSWDDNLEKHLADAWDDQKAGNPFVDVKRQVRLGWDKNG